MFDNKVLKEEFQLNEEQMLESEKIIKYHPRTHNMFLMECNGENRISWMHDIVFQYTQSNVFMTILYNRYYDYTANTREKRRY
jgi:hypothetical protein